MKKLSISFLTLFVCLTSVISQEIIEVQAFNYDSETRDSTISFPTESNNNFEKIWMIYSMRCKDGLVSTAADRNRGCGEWDYSCNTYIHDPSRFDSTAATHPNYLISNFSGDQFSYTSQPTYTYYQYEQKDVVYNQVNAETKVTLGAGNESISPILDAQPETVKSLYLYQGVDLFGNGLLAGEIDGLEIDVDDNAKGYKNFRIKMRNTTDNELNPNDPLTSNFKEVYFKNTEFIGGTTHSFKFFEPFVWNGTNLLVEFSYDKEGQESTTVKGDQEAFISALTNEKTDKNLEFTGAERVEIENAIPEISNEITVSFWQYGGDEMPTNSTIFEAKDGGNNRTVNIHLPWGNSQVYWDCGNSGGSYDRINKSANVDNFKGKWNHWAFTKNATTGDMKIYLNGTLWHSGSNMHRPIDIQALNIGRSILGGAVYFGKLDEFRLWNKELSQSQISDWMYKSIDATHPEFNSLIVYYDFDTPNASTISDLSGNGYNAEIDGDLQFRNYRGEEIFKGFNGGMAKPKTTFVQGDYSMNVNTLIHLDSLVNAANKMEEFVVDGTDLVSQGVQFVYAAGDMPVFDEDGNQISSVNVPSEASVDIIQLDYYRKTPAKYEIMSFVTPYGIFLDLGWEGKTWIFDVTDFGPVLNGDRRITMERGGQWQEDIDIKFMFVRGTPSRDVIDINQVWPVTHENFNQILSDNRFEPRELITKNDATMFKLRAAVTGHGQEGEFIPRNHYLNVNGGSNELIWRVWKECAGNPIHPQGGTWVYDRAGWCPGMATDLVELDISSLITPGQGAMLDYGLAETPTGDSRYIVNVQMVSYGDPNFSLDAGILDIMNPSKKAAYEKFNPLCMNPQIRIVNNGSTPLTSLTITYGVEGGQESTFDWSGNLAFLETEDVDLPNMPLANMTESSNFYAVVSNPNGQEDEYDNNNEMSSEFDVVDFVNEDVMVIMFTNNAYWETKYTLEDSDGNVVFQRTTNIEPNTLYTDTIKGLSGCYRLHITDSGNDGIAWWANNDGNGYIQFRGVGESPILLEPDFGSFLIHEFIAGDPLTNTNEIVDSKHLRIYPNPSSDIFNLEIQEMGGPLEIKLFNQMGQLIYSEKLIDNSGPIRFTNLDLTDELDGIYFLYITSENQRLTQKIIKQ